MADANDAHYAGLKVMQDHLNQSFREAQARFPRHSEEHLQALRDVVRRDVLEALRMVKEMYIPITGHNVSPDIRERTEFWDGLRKASIDFSRDMNHSLRKEIAELKLNVEGHSQKVSQRVA